MAPFIKDKKLVLGGILVIIGLLLFFRNSDFFFFHFPHWLFSWPTILLGIGLVAFLTSDNPTAGIILMAIGGFFLLQNVFGPMFHFTIQFWPLLIVLVGVLLILRHRRGSQVHHHNRSGEDLGADYIDEIAIFGGGEKNITSKNLKGGKLTAIFGGGDIDFTHAELAEGVSEIEVFAMFGGWDIIVPAHWNVEIKITPLLGGFSDKRRFYESETVDNTRKVIFRGIVIFGGGEIKSYKTK